MELFENTCGACGKDAIYSGVTDRTYHIDGSDNVDCHVAYTRGDVKTSLHETIREDRPARRRDHLRLVV